MIFSLPALLGAALVPLVVGSIYYSKALAGKSWMAVNGFSDNDLKGANMAVIFGVSFLLSVLLAFIMTNLVIHQNAVAGLLMDNPTAMNSDGEYIGIAAQFMEQFSGSYRYFGHGAVHGAFISVFLVLPILAINALFERRGWKYILIHFGYWLITLVLMGGIISQFS